METALIALIAAAASLLTFFSGFGLGTLLLPIFLLFYPVDVAIIYTAIVHLMNGIFKFALMGRHVHVPIALQFGIPAIVFALLGAWLLVYLSSFPIHVQYKLIGYSLSTSPVKVVIGILLLVFAAFEIFPLPKKGPSKRKEFLWLGGALSGFFGGLSGHQGALRSAFLIRAGLTKESFIATGIAIALVIDLTRLPVYFRSVQASDILIAWPVIAAATLAAFAGAYAGSRMLKKVSINFVQYFVASAVVVIGILLALGVV